MLALKLPLKAVAERVAAFTPRPSSWVYLGGMGRPREEITASSRMEEISTYGL